MNFVKLKKSTIAKTISTIIFSISLVFCNVIPVFASTAVDQESLYPILKTSGNSYLYPVTGNSKTVSRYTTITDLLAQYADQSTLNQKTTYTLLNGTFKGYIDGVESTLSNIDTKLGNISGYVDGVETGITNINTNLTNIKSYVDGLEGYLDGVEGYIDGLETAFTTNNTRLNEIKNAINSITTYNYTQVLSDILTNTGYLSTIDTYTQSIQDSIGYGSSGDNVLSKLSSLINSNTNIDTNTSNLYTYVTNFTARNSQVWWRTSNNYSLQRTGQSGSYNIGGFAIPERATSNNHNSETYRWKYLAGSNTNLMSALESLSITDNFTLSKLMTPYSTYLQPVYDINTNSLVTMKDDYGYNVGALSLADIIDHFNKQFLLSLGKLQYVLADDDTISAKNANKTQEQAVLTNFTGQGNASASANDFGDVASGVASVSSGLNTGVSISNIFNIYNNRDGYGFWSVETQNELNTTNASRSYKSNRGSSTPLYDSKLSEIYSYMGVNYD